MTTRSRALMHRELAIKIIVDHELPRLSSQERLSEVVNSWGLDEEDPEYHSLPPDLQAALHEANPPEDATPALFDPLIRLSLRYDFRGVRNDYICRKLRDVSGIDAEVVGEVELLLPCVCCGYRTLTDGDPFEICLLCGWETGGEQQPHEYSSLNRMTLGQARHIVATNGTLWGRSHDSEELDDLRARYTKDLD